MTKEEERPRFCEIIVVEGRDDITAVKRAVDAEVIAVRGFAVRHPETLALLKSAQKRAGVIVLTDPDRAGEIIRDTIEKHVPGIKHAYILRADGTRASDGNIGVENASSAVIKTALLQARSKQDVPPVPKAPIFTIGDLMRHGLSGCPEANARRQQLGQQLGIGYASGKQFLRRLHAFGITREEFEDAVDAMS